MNPSKALILHILPMDMARGSQNHARALRDALDTDEQNHRVMTLFASGSFGLKPDYSLNANSGRLRSLGFQPTAYLKLHHALRRLRPKLVVAHGSESLKYGMLARPPGTRLIYHRIGISSRKLGNPIRLSLHRALVRRADAVVALSIDSLDELRRIVAPERVVLIPNARDVDLYHPSHDAAVTGRPRLLFLGHHVATKRPQLFLDVVAALRERELDFDADMAGDGPLRIRLEKRAAEVGVRMLGSRGDVPRLLNQASILVFTSVPEGEGMPGVLIEAGLSGVPAVSTAVPGAREVIDDGVTGFVVGIDDLESLISGVGLLISDLELRTRMGAAARVRCLEQFNIKTSAAKWRSLIGQLVGR